LADLTKAERNALLQRAWELDSRLYPEDRSTAPRGRDAASLREMKYQALGEYADRLPRIVMSACPFTGEALKRSFDRWGLDGPWWYQDREFTIEEPRPPPSFKILLGALQLGGRTPVESRDPLIPGPEVPFVVPRLLGLPGMVAVVSSLQLDTGDTAYPIAYFSEESIAPADLHQPWLHQEFWFTTPEGKSGWLVANDVWDFDLAPYLQSGKLRWIAPGDSNGVVVDEENWDRCPYVDLPGDRFPQSIAGGVRDLLPLPDGVLINPFDET